MLLFAGITTIFQRFLPQTKQTELSEQSFMVHMQKDSRSVIKTIIKLVITSYQVIIIIIFAVILSNTLLLPVYLLQISFPGFFAVLFAAGLGLLGLFYTRQYVHVSQAQHSRSGIVSGMSFLGFRILKNTLFILSILCIVIGALIGIAFMANFNVNLLENSGILMKPGAL